MMTPSLVKPLNMLIKYLVKITHKVLLLLILTPIDIVLTPQPIEKDPPPLFVPTQSQPAISPNTFTAQDAGIYSQKEFKRFWNSVLFTKLSEDTLKLPGKTISYDLVSKNSPELLSSNPYKFLRIVLHEYMLNLTPFFHQNGSLTLSLNSSDILVIFSAKVDFISLLLSCYNLPLTHSLFYIALSLVSKFLQNKSP